MIIVVSYATHSLLWFFWSYGLHDDWVFHQCSVVFPGSIHVVPHGTVHGWRLAWSLVVLITAGCRLELAWVRLHRGSQLQGAGHCSFCWWLINGCWPHSVCQRSQHQTTAARVYRRLWSVVYMYEWVMSINSIILYLWPSIYLRVLLT